MLKKFKKAVSMVAALAVVLSAMIVPTGAVSAAEGSTKVSYGAWTNVVNENFGSYTDVSGVTSAGWTISKKNASDGFADSSVAKIDTPVTGNNAIGILGSSGASYYLDKKLDTPITSGQVKVTVMVKPTGKVGTPVLLFNGDSTVQVVNFDNDLNMYETFNGWTNVGSYTVNKWYSISVLIDYDANKLNYVITPMNDDGTGVSGQPVVNKSITTNPIASFKGIRLGTWSKGTANGTYTYFDDIKFATRTQSEVLGTYVSENFDNIDYASELWADGWGMNGTPIVKFSDADANGNKSLIVGKHGVGVPIVDNSGNALTSGKIQMDFSIKLPANNSKFIANFAQTAGTGVGSTGSDNARFLYFSDTSYIAKGCVYSSVPADNEMNTNMLYNNKTYSADTWYDINIIMDMSAKTYTLNILSNDEVIGGKTGTITDGLKYLVFRNWLENDVYIDNIVVKDYEEPVVEFDPVLLNETFENGTLESRGWTVGNTTEIATAAALSSKAAKLTFQYTDSNTSSGTPSITHTFDKVTSGKLKISYTIIPESGSAPSWIVTKKNGATSDTNVDLVYFFYGQTGTPTISASTGDVYGQKIGNYTEEKTYKVEATIDIDAGTIERIVTDVADSTVVTKTTENHDIAEISGIKFANWKKDSTAGTYVTYIDDVKVEIYEELPSLSASSVTIYDADSNVVSGTSSVPANISKIVLDFGAKLDAETVEGAITLKTAGGAAVNCDVAVDENDASKVNVTLNEVLSFKTGYVLNVANTVENYIGGAMETAFEYPFTTGAAVKTAKIASVSASTLAEISANSTVTVTANVVNQGSVALPLTFIAAYFKGNQLVYCSIDNTKTSADVDANGTVTSAPLATLASMEGITRVEFYLWNTMSGMIPYDTAKIIGQ